MVLIPLLGIFVVNYLGKPENHSHSKWMNALFLLAGLLISAVFTNDLHQQVFFFHKGIELFDSQYQYRFLYVINVKVCQKILGHADLSTTLGIYSHVLPSVAKEAAQKIGALVYEAG